MIAPTERRALPPGPEEPAIVQLARWVYRPMQFMEDCHRRFGAWYTVRFPRDLLLVFTSSPGAIREVFAADSEAMFGGQGNSHLTPLVGRNSLLVLDGEPHLRARKLMAPPFHGERMLTHAGLIRDIASSHIARWPRGRTFLLHPAMKALTSEILFDLVFGEASDRFADFKSSFADLMETMNGPAAMLATGVFGGIPFSKWQAALGGWTPVGRWLRLRRSVDDALSLEIEERKRLGSRPRNGILSLLIESRDPGGRGFSDEELKDQLMTLLAAGYDSAATALC